MDVVASTSSASSTEEFKVKVPKSRKENRILKTGFVDDNNDTLSYLDLAIVWPATVFAVLSMSFFIVAIATSLYTDYIPTEKELQRTFFAVYGSTSFACNTTLPIPADGIPSVLKLLEINAVGNVMFRLCVCIPVALRLFISNTHCAMLRAEYELLPFFFRVSIEVVPVLAFIEVFSLALFSIITAHSDFPDVNRFFKILFVMTANVNMVLAAAVQYSYSKSSQQRIDQLSAVVKTTMACVFCYLAPQYFSHIYSPISFPICHSYMPRMYAFMEYVMIIAYFMFHLTSIIDIRHISFICYPRTCSGECEPLDPKNFVRHGKFEHCRAYEYQQHRVHNL